LSAKSLQKRSSPSGLGGLATPAGLAVLLALLGLALYWPATGFEFSRFDDQTYYAQNERVQAGLSWNGIKWALGTDTASNWHPLTWLSLMLDADLGDGLGDARVPHFTNLVLHSLNGALLLLLLWRMTGAKWRSALAAGLFTVHPLNVESVAWVAERKNVLSQFFFLVSLLAYVRYAKTAPGRNPAEAETSKLFYRASLGAFALALMSKPMVVTLPFVLLLLDVWPLQRVSGLGAGVSGLGARGMGFDPLGWRWREKWPFFALSLLGCSVTYWVQWRTNAVQTADVFPLAGRLANAVISYERYLDKAFWPVDLAVFYPYPGGWPALRVGLAAVGLGLISLAAVWRLRQTPYLFTGWFWFLGTLVPVIGLVQAGKQAMADRYAYLPLIGIFIVVVWGGFECLNRAKLPRAALFLLAGLCLAAGTVAARRQLGYWRNDGTLFSHALAVTQNNEQAEVTLGAYLEKVNEPAEAARHYRAAVALDASDKNAHFDLANVLGDLGDVETSLKEYRAALRCDPAFYPAHYNLAYELEHLGRREEAVAEYRAALRFKPDLAAAQQHLAGLGVTAE
jgi:tetratricopeptide (TPR) repeat protein